MDPVIQDVHICRRVSRLVHGLGGFPPDGRHRLLASDEVNRVANGHLDRERFTAILLNIRMNSAIKMDFAADA